VFEGRGAIHACTAWLHRNVLIGGAPVPILVAHSLRVHESRHGERLADFVRRHPPRAFEGDTHRIRNAQREDLDAYAVLITRTHRRFGLFAPYSVENLAARLGQGYPEKPPAFIPHVYGCGDKSAGFRLRRRSRGFDGAADPASAGKDGRTRPDITRRSARSAARTRCRSPTPICGSGERPTQSLSGEGAYT